MVKSRRELVEALNQKFSAYRKHLRDHANQRPTDRDASRQPVVAPKDRTDSQPNCELVVIGTSTGGPQALRHVVPRLDALFPVPVLIVQHMPPDYTAMLARRLNDECQLTVKEPSHGETLEVGRVYLAPGGKHTRLKRRGQSVIVELTDDPPVHSCRPAVDYTLQSAIDALGGNLLAVVMTGMGKDGSEGCVRLKQTGGTVFVQDANTSAVYGMPKAVVETGTVDRVLPLAKIAPAITRHVNRHAPVRQRTT